MIQNTHSGGAHAVLSNDPDADPFVAAEVCEAEDVEKSVKIFNGDEIAALIADYNSTRLQKRENSKDLSDFS